MYLILGFSNILLSILTLSPAVNVEGFKGSLATTKVIVKGVESFSVEIVTDCPVNEVVKLVPNDNLFLIPVLLPSTNLILLPYDLSTLNDVSDPSFKDTIISSSIPA